MNPIGLWLTLASCALLLSACAAPAGADEPPAKAFPDAGAEPAPGPLPPLEPRFPDYRPKSTPDTVLDYRPQLVERIRALPPAELEALPKLLTALGDMCQRADARPGEERDGNVILGAPPKEYCPSDEELLEAELGARLRAVLASHPPEVVRATLKRAGWRGPWSVEFGDIDVDHSDVMGSGRFFYADRPEPTRLDLPRP